MNTLSGIDIAILAAEAIAAAGLLTGIILYSGKLKKLRRQNSLNQERMQKSSLDDMLSNDKLKNEKRR